ncbi:hypothetical protein BRD19_09890 [Halobacteriales archaeon SW_7_65_23]|nr:MAG: hypothetical protein BRD19_09890 [Halobacteriales archaeon SW_7_65_23]
MIPITDVDDLIEEFVEQKRYVEEEKPYWINLTGGTRHSGELRYELENYFPEAHYREAIDQAFREQAEEKLKTDGGTAFLHQDGRRNRVYYWVNPETGAALYHTEANGEEANPFFGSVGEAEQFLERQAGEDAEKFEGYSLYEARIQKIEDAVEVIMDQSGIDDFW